MATTTKTVLVIGPTGSGKTSLLRRLTTGEFPVRTRPTVGLDTRAARIDFDTGVNVLTHQLAEELNVNGVRLDVWELGGKEVCRREMPRGSHIDGLLVCYDASSRDSFHRAVHLLSMHRVDWHLSQSRAKGIEMDFPASRGMATILCGTKADIAEEVGHNATVAAAMRGLPPPPQPVAASKAEVDEVVRAQGMHGAVVTSAKTGDGIAYAFHLLALSVLRSSRDIVSEEAATREFQRSIYPAQESWSLTSEGVLASSGPMTCPRGLRPREPARPRGGGLVGAGDIIAHGITGSKAASGAKRPELETAEAIAQLAQEASVEAARAAGGEWLPFGEEDGSNLHGAGHEFSALALAGSGSGCASVWAPVQPAVVEEEGGEYLVEVIDATGVACLPRTLMRCLERGLLHRAIHLWLVVPRSGAVLLRRRSPEALKYNGKWGPTCYTEVLCYGTGGEGHASELSRQAATRALEAQLGVMEAAVGELTHWFSCTSRYRNCCELLDVYVAGVGGQPPAFKIRTDEEIEWLFYEEVFGKTAERAGTTLPFPDEYRYSFRHRMRPGVVRADARLAFGDRSGL